VIILPQSKSEKIAREICAHGNTQPFYENAML